MTKDDIIRMAREAATEDGSVKRTDGKNVVIYAAKTNRFLERFAALVAAHEREACAKLCEDKAMRLETKAQEAIEAGEHGEVNAIRSTAWQISVCAAEIRARGQELRKGEHG